jgi:hypothetical protein
MDNLAGTDSRRSRATAMATSQWSPLACAPSLVVHVDAGPHADARLRTLEPMAR